MNGIYLPKVSRRTTLKWIAAAVVGAALPRHGQAEERLAIFKPTPQGYGSDPNLNHPVIPWKRMMTQHQLQLTAVFADLLLPATSTAPAPTTLGIPDFIDEWVSAPYPDQLRDRATLLDGLAALDRTATRRWGKDFLHTSVQQKQVILDRLIADWQKAPSAVAGNRFFYRFRTLVLGAYYTTTEGYKDIGYLGNVPMGSYPPATETEKTILEREFTKLGLGVQRSAVTAFPGKLG